MKIIITQPVRIRVLDVILIEERNEFIFITLDDTKQTFRYDKKDIVKMELFITETK